MWRIALHPRRDRMVGLGMLIAAGLIAGTPFGAFSVVLVVAVSTSLFEALAPSMRALRTLPVSTRALETDYWLLAMGPVATVLPSCGLLGVVLVQGFSPDARALASLTMATVLGVICSGGLLTCIGAGAKSHLSRGKSPFYSRCWLAVSLGALGILAYSVIVGVFLPLQAMPVDVPHWIPFQPLFCLLAAAVALGTFLARGLLVAPVLYPGDRAEMALPARSRVESRRFFDQSRGFFDTYMSLAVGLLPWFAGVATAVATPVVAFVMWYHQPYAELLDVTVLGMMVGTWVPALLFGIEALPPIRAVRILPLTAWQLTMRLAGYMAVPSALAALFTLPAAWYCGRVGAAAAFNCALMGAAILSAAFYVGSGNGAPLTLRLSGWLAYFFVMGVAGACALYPVARVLPPLAATGVVYACAGVALFHYAITGSGWVYGGSRRKGGSV